jgi:hypothetical protein
MFFLLLLGVVMATPQYFEHHARCGENITLNCPDTNIDFWFDKERKVINNSNKYTLFNDSLTIYNINPLDHNEYTCFTSKAFEHGGIETHKFNVVVDCTNLITINVNSVEVSPKKHKIIITTDKLFPRKKSLKVLVNSNTVLSNISCSQDSNRFFTCKWISNKLFPADSYNITVAIFIENNTILQSKTLIILDEIAQPLYYTQCGKDILIVCPEKSFSWYKQKNEINKYTILKDLLTIHNLKPSDQGRYLCFNDFDKSYVYDVIVNCIKLITINLSSVEVEPKKHKIIVTIDQLFYQIKFLILLTNNITNTNINCKQNNTTYRCISNTLVPANLYNITVYIAIENNTISQTKTLTILDGLHLVYHTQCDENITLTCPKRSVFWSKKGEIIKFLDNVLTIYNISPLDQGNYLCSTNFGIYKFDVIVDCINITTINLSSVKVLPKKHKIVVTINKLFYQMKDFKILVNDDMISNNTNCSQKSNTTYVWISDTLFLADLYNISVIIFTEDNIILRNGTLIILDKEVSKNDWKIIVIVLIIFFILAIIHIVILLKRKFRNTN